MPKREDQEAENDLIETLRVETTNLKKTAEACFRKHCKNDRLELEVTFKPNVPATKNGPKLAVIRENLVHVRACVRTMINGTRNNGG